MTLADSLMISLFGFTVVFLVLFLLSLLIKFQSLFLRQIITYKYKLDGPGTKSPDTSTVLAEGETSAAEVSEAVDEGWSAGELKLLGVDEKTAAMIMAIISDESQIPLSELQFKMIRAIN